MNKIRWLILILGPLPIVGSSWAVSGWLKPHPRAGVDRNDVLPTVTGPRAADKRDTTPRAIDDVDPDVVQACHVSALRTANELGPDCRVIERAPFVLGGNLPFEELDRWHTETIEPAVQAMRSRYFHSAPKQPITVLLFRDEQSYNDASRRLFDEAVVSIYGYYKPNLRTLLMNAATGPGTLLHELTHALMDVDFPDAPDWFNEGLASLHEQCRFNASADGPWIEGLPNWRLAGLQRLVRDGQLRSLKSLIGDRDFRGPLEGANYAQARYFCMYMQQHGLLERFYEVLRAGGASDSRGLSAVAAVFPGTSWKQLDQQFQLWVSELRESPPAQGR